MSGGHFEYSQYHIEKIADEIQNIIENNDSDAVDGWGIPIGRGYPEEVIDLFKRGEFYLRLAYIYARNIDWLISGDTGEETFIQRIQDDYTNLAYRNTDKDSY